MVESPIDKRHLILIGVALASPGKDWLLRWAELAGKAELQHRDTLTGELAMACYNRDNIKLEELLRHLGVRDEPEPIAALISRAADEASRPIIERRIKSAAWSGVDAATQLRAVAAMVDELNAIMDRLRKEVINV